MSQAHSPFKFLDSYQKTDAEVFFGREKETEALYNALSGVKHLIVYGPSGSGKTSLIECGLRNQFSDADWYALTIRKGADINASVFTAINEVLTEKIELDAVTKMPVVTEIEFVQVIEQLFAERYQPVYLLFDQFEELLISGEDAEKKKFFTLLNKLIRNKVPCRIILIMREEFIGHLSEFEADCPSIFQHRFRVERMGIKNVEEVIEHILEAPAYQPFFKVDNSQELAKGILSKLPDNKREIELAHVQVFLGELWDRAQITKKENELPVLNTGLVYEEDNLEKILESFLKKQIAELEMSYGDKLPLELLSAMISEKFTKLQLSEAAIKEDLEQNNVISEKSISNLLEELQQRRIVRSLKSGNETQYEISHDVLALVVGQNRTTERKMREKARDIYKMYQERKGLFTQEDIDYLRSFKQNLDYPEDLQGRINQSNAFIQNQKEANAQKKLDEFKQIKHQQNLKWGIGILILVFIIIISLLLTILSKNKEIKYQNNEITSQNRTLADTLRLFKDSVTTNYVKINLLENQLKKILNDKNESDSVIKVINKEVSTDAIKPRIYMHLYDKNLKPLLEKLVDSLKLRGYIIPGIEMVDYPVNPMQLRYFKSDERKKAQEVVEKLKLFGYRDAKAAYMPGFENNTKVRQYHFELWWK